MPKKLSVKKIIELDNACMSGRDIAIALSISRNSVAEVLNTAKVLGLSWKEIERKEENEIYRLLFPNKFNFYRDNPDMTIHIIIEKILEECKII